MKIEITCPDCGFYEYKVAHKNRFKKLQLKSVNEL